MDAFGDNFDQAADPAADFLAREQQDMAGLEDDLAIAPAVTQQIKTEGKFSFFYLFKSNNASIIIEIMNCTIFILIY